MSKEIKLLNLTTGYAQKVITKDVTATVASAKLTCLLGPNGAGKSTLMRTLAGFIPPITGNIYIGDESISKISPRKLARCIGVVLTERPNTINMTVNELVALGRTPYTSFLGGLTDSDKRIVGNAIEAVGISALQERNVNTLSDGEFQKALIAKVIAQRTDIILLDEPTAFLDFPSKVEIMQMLRQFAHQENKTILMSTHDIDIALQMADELWLLDRNHGLSCGASAQLSQSGDLEKYFNSDSVQFNASERRFNIKL